MSDRAFDSASLYERVRRVVPAIEWPVFAPDVEAILRLKRERDAVVLAHNYMTPEIYHCVADIVGDSLALAKEAAKIDAGVIVMAGVSFMAETAKIMNPDKVVLMPDMRAGCSLAASITAADVRELRRRHPGVPIVAYVNTTAAVKAEVDICCTSANAKQVVESLGSPRVILVPDKFLAANVAAMTDVEIITWDGACEVHERFGPEEVRELREAHPDAVVLAHPECPPEVVAAADFSGSTAQMSAFVGERRPRRAVLLTECAMSDNIAVDHPDVEFLRPCNLCPHMKRITLPAIRRALETMTTAIEIDPKLAERARRSIARMVAL
ncbi:MAG TPA: quinolinate synthase NadA [Roseiarcus sp.]|jgi:quinolinate synthase